MCLWINEDLTEGNQMQYTGIILHGIIILNYQLIAKNNFTSNYLCMYVRMYKAQVADYACQSLALNVLKFGGENAMQ